MDYAVVYLWVVVGVFNFCFLGGQGVNLDLMNSNYQVYCFVDIIV